MDAAPLISPNRAIRMLKLELVIDVGVRAFALIVFPIIQAREVEARIDHRNETAALAPAELERSWNDRTVLFAEIDGGASADLAVGRFHVDSSRRFRRRIALPEHPIVFPQPIDRAFDRLADSKPGLPPERLDSVRFQKNKRAVPDPPSLAARIGEPGMELQSLADPLGGVIHLAVLAGTEVENIQAT